MKPVALLCTLLLLLFSVSAFAETVVEVDNLGRKTVKEVPSSTTASRPGLRSLSSGIVAVSGDSTVSPVVVKTYTPHPFDLTVSLGATGVSNNTGVDEAAVLGLSLNYFATSWLTVGLGFERDAAAPKLLQLNIPLKAYLWPRPDTSAKPYARLIPFTYTVRTGQDAPQPASPWSFNPSVVFGLEFPQSGYSLSVDLGAGYVFTEGGADVNEFAGFTAAGRFNGWLGR